MMLTDKDKTAGGVQTLQRQPKFKKLFGVAVVSIGIAMSTLIYKETRPELYQAKAKILLLAPQEQYLPDIERAHAQGATDMLVGKAEQIRTKLANEMIASRIVARYQLTAEDGYIQKSLWQQALEMSGTGLLTGSDKQLAVAAVQNWIDIDYQSDRRLLTIAFRGPNPKQATYIANSLAQSYLDLIETEKAKEFGSAVAKLKADTDLLQSRVQKTKDEMIPSSIPAGLSEEQSNQWVAEEQLRIAGLEKKATAEQNLLDHMLSRYLEARTRQSLDLLPPQARLIARATSPIDPIKTNGLKSSAINGGAVFLSLLCLMGFVSFRTKRNETKSRDVPSMPEAVVWAPTELQRHTHSSPIERPVDAAMHEAECSKDDDVMPSADDATVADYVAQCILYDSHNRVVLMSDEANWGGVSDLLARNLAASGLSLVSIHLGPSGVHESQDANGDAFPGVSDLVDGEAVCAEIVFVDEESGVPTVLVGRRSLTPEDFFSRDFHAFLIALEATYDLLLIDIGPHYDDEFALKSLGVARDALACIYAPETEPNVSSQVRDVMQHFGYKDSLILPLDMQTSYDQMDAAERFEAAE